MRLSARISRVCTYATIAALLLAFPCGGTLAGGFGIEQSAYYQGMSFAGAAAGGESLTSLLLESGDGGLRRQRLIAGVELLRGSDVGQPHRDQSAGPTGDGSCRNTNGPQCPRRGELRHLAARQQDGVGGEPHLPVRTGHEGREPRLGR